MTRYATTSILVFSAAYLLLSAGDATGLSASMRLTTAGWMLLPGVVLAVAAWRLENVPGPQVIILVSATLLAALTITAWRWMALGPPNEDAAWVLALLPIVEIFLLLPALLAAWLAQSLHLLRQLRDLRPEADAVARLAAELAATQARVAVLESVLEEQGRLGRSGNS